MANSSAEAPVTSWPLKRGKVLGLIVLSVLFVVAGAAIFWMALTGDDIRRNRVVMLIAGPVAVLFFGYAAITLIRRFVQHGRLAGFEVTPDGFRDRTSNLAPPSLVPWSEVTAFDFVSQQRQHYLAFVLADPEGFREHLPSGRLAQTAYQANLRLLGPVHPVHLNILDATPQQLTAAIVAVTGDRFTR